MEDYEAIVPFQALQMLGFRVRLVYCVFSGHAVAAGALDFCHHDRTVPADSLAQQARLCLTLSLLTRITPRQVDTACPNKRRRQALLVSLTACLCSL